MQVAGIRRVSAPVEMTESGEPRPLAGDEVLLEVGAAGLGNWHQFVRTGGWDVGAKPPMALGVESVPDSVAGPKILAYSCVCTVAAVRSLRRAVWSTLDWHASRYGFAQLSQLS
jgi:hypothetical protein